MRQSISAPKTFKVVIANAIVLGLEADYHDWNFVWHFLDHFFAIYFAIEVSAPTAAHPSFTFKKSILYIFVVACVCVYLSVLPQVVCMCANVRLCVTMCVYWSPDVST